ncbi:tRNA (N(6)-L-threonylcarbamoyladenosine(37)-C(2))-methylthiotransferase MtaB [Candidatus Xianfuyuplasma coldseepsis]|uniref:Threonylcarbamoyladenosine tRNA methylthiotransferase MtaB n=1 Tax=Candidatus Xianfuyuplasma coldseepsis TaxID=2782163 RepID=A0A7L7KV99_9MOLU|nr:tRNA (N(6)-L-threonylcarbamoyladenosine(37)-C(2))-methylthiotransferase MtaB [Xianfuyuplasma coldseepsis]QMS85914.1 tRNA (N(6)-L-threonylcarbamoyladenosine(37)-C(2))-methylthiotransferase MtaB [Xianfuyuplasma coldseepsis]
MNIAFHTLGCKVNTYETESVWTLFEQAGYTRVKPSEYADVYVINTCTVTNQGDAKSRKVIRQLIKKNPEAIIAVMGCYAQIDPDTIRAIDGVDIIIGTKQRERLVMLVEEYRRKRQQIEEVTDVSRYRVFDETHVTHFTENTRAFLKIQDGCNNFCSYCIIPFARGPVRSRDPKSVLQEAADLVRNGYQEIVLTGIHTGGYGTDLENYSLYQLLQDLIHIEGLNRLRISSIEINELTDDIISLIARSKQFANHLHIPLQSGSDAILQAMRRKYTTAQFQQRIQEIRQKIPNIAITTDVIVGFPGETDDHFLEMKECIKTMAFSELHVFPYSKRNGTKAALLSNQINGVVKSIRVNELLQLNEELATNYIAQQEELSVLFETSDDQYTYGHSDTYIYVKTPRNTTLHNQIVTCTVVTKNYKDVLVKIKKVEQ